MNRTIKDLTYLILMLICLQLGLFCILYVKADNNYNTITETQKSLDTRINALELSVFSGFYK